MSVIEPLCILISLFEIYDLVSVKKAKESIERNENHQQERYFPKTKNITNYYKGGNWEKKDLRKRKNTRFRPRKKVRFKKKKIGKNRFDQGKKKEITISTMLLIKKKSTF